ncbi:hypothetical protein D9615_003155 [Tricholomella constricta]|uniref:Copper-fist domain-containing protein n=1 Tax=Tricholomella constricta TaxID=117010 RepID=A0A8H5HJP0_9AGAR|nr:hypothetical protein D9615_003155 [Tricholomella constricta]
MVLINGNKYACETCIKGHRSSTCRHTDRPLFEIKKKGRPVTQCDHCRELRKKKQVHIKCVCVAKEDPSANQSSGSKKGHTKIPDSATYPLGLPEALGASVVERVSSDSDPGGGTCDCWTPRKSAPRNRKKGAAASHTSTGLPKASSVSGSRTPSHILARLAELRPVLPRPSYPDRPNSGPSHDPSSNTAVRHRSHENVHFSPYGRAYDITHEQIDSVANQNQNLISPPIFPTPVFPTDEQILRDQLRALEAATAPPPGTGLIIPPFPSTCGCGDGCRCPGCVQHNPDASPASSAFSCCTNPSACSTCLDCTILSLPASLPPDTSLSIYDAYQTDSIDDWIRQVSSLPRSSPGIPTPSNITGIVGPQGDQQPWDGFLPPITEPLPADPNFGYVVQPCCGVLCKCAPEHCECDVEHENGYDCRREMLLPMLSPSYPQIHSADANNADVVPLGHDHDGFLLGGKPVDDTSMYFDAGPELGGRFLGIPEPPRSRSSSTSSSQSQSSRELPPQQQQQQKQHPFTTQPLSAEYSYPGQPLGRVRGPFYASSPNLGLRLQNEPKSALSLSGGSSPASVSPARSVPGVLGFGDGSGNGNGTYAVSNPDSDGSVSADDRDLCARWRE